MKAYREVELHAFLITYTVNEKNNFNSSHLYHPDIYLETH